MNSPPTLHFIIHNINVGIKYTLKRCIAYILGRFVVQKQDNKGVQSDRCTCQTIMHLSMLSPTTPLPGLLGDFDPI